MPIYEFRKPADLAKFLQSLPRLKARQWWVRLEKQYGKALLAEVKVIITAKRLQNKAGVVK
jgi:hypothetical protein